MMTPEDGHAKRWEISNKNDAFHGEKHRKIWKPWKKTLFLWRFLKLTGKLNSMISGDK